MQFFNYELPPLRIRFLREPGIECAGKTVSASRNASAALNLEVHYRSSAVLRFCLYIPVVLTQEMYWYSVNAPLKKRIHPFRCDGFVSCYRSGYRNKRIGTM